MAAPEPASRTVRRSCRVCRTKAAKSQLKRWVQTPDGLALDPTQTMPGRGFYTDKAKCEEILPQIIKKRGK